MHEKQINSYLKSSLFTAEFSAVRVQFCAVLLSDHLTDIDKMINIKSFFLDRCAGFSADIKIPLIFTKNN